MPSLNFDFTFHIPPWGQIPVLRLSDFAPVNLFVKATDMPGVAEKDIDIMLEKDVLTINGYVANVTAPEGYDLGHGEYGIGDYQRSFTLPDEIDRDNIEASLSHGVLRVTLPKAPEAQTRKITVKAV